MADDEPIIVEINNVLKKPSKISTPSDGSAETGRGHDDENDQRLANLGANAREFL